MEKKTLGSFLAALRKSSGMTQKDLAERLCVSDKAVSRWERDETYPDLTMIPVIADIFGVSSDELLRGQRGTGESNGTVSDGYKRSEKEVKVYSERVLFRYLAAVMICIGSVVAACLIRSILYSLSNPGPPAGVVIYNLFEGICIGVWIAVIVVVVLYYLSNRNKLAGLEDYESILEPAKRKLQRRFRWALLVAIAMFAFVFMHTGELEWTAFIIFGVIVGVPLLIKFVGWLVFSGNQSA